MEAVLLAVTLLSLTIAVATSALAWRTMRNERLRSEARIAALAADLASGTDRAAAAATAVVETAAPSRAPVPTPPIVAAAAPVGPAAVADLPFRDEEAVAPAQGMFVPGERGRSPMRVAAALGVAVVIVAAVIGSLVMTSDRRSTPAAERSITPAEAAPAASAPAALPLELIALGHEREADRLTVRGVVRGAAPAGEKGPLTAVVLLFNRDGSFVASGRAEVQPGASDPAGERTFVVTVPSPRDVGRYRVSFRSDDHIVPHVDKRVQAGTLKSDGESGKSQI